MEQKLRSETFGNSKERRAGTSWGSTLIQIHIVSRSFATTASFLKKVLCPLLLILGTKKKKSVKWHILCAVQESLQTGLTLTPSTIFKPRKSLMFSVLKRTNFSQSYEKFYLKCKLCIKLWYGITLLLWTTMKAHSEYIFKTLKRTWFYCWDCIWNRLTHL